MVLPEWRELIEEESGDTYYHNKVTKETFWKKPIALLVPQRQNKVIPSSSLPLENSRIYLSRVETSPSSISKTNTSQTLQTSRITISPQSKESNLEEKTDTGLLNTQKEISHQNTRSSLQQSTTNKKRSSCLK